MHKSNVAFDLLRQKSTALFMNIYFYYSKCLQSVIHIEVNKIGVIFEDSSSIMILQIFFYFVRLVISFFF